MQLYIDIYFVYSYFCICARLEQTVILFSDEELSFGEAKVQSELR